jgi:ATP-dependent RNA helicase DeaD
MGFKDDLDFILDKTSNNRQTMLFSATMSKEVISISKKYMKDAKEIAVAKVNSAAKNVEHHIYDVNSRHKYDALKRIADYNPNIYGIVFCRTRRQTKEITKKFINDGYNADAIHGDLSQGQRDEVMSRFRDKSLQMLIATDVAARGLDVEDLTHIINYSLPDDPEIYTHRSGRTGRAGKSGISIAISNSRESRKIKSIENKSQIKFLKKEVPTGKDICSIQLFKLIEKIEKVKVDDKQIEPYLDDIYKKLEWLSREDLIKHFVSAEFNRFLEYYKGSNNINNKSQNIKIMKTPEDEINSISYHSKSKILKNKKL